MFESICRDFFNFSLDLWSRGGRLRGGRDTDRVVRTVKAERRQLGSQLAPNPGRRARVGKECSADRDVTCAGREQLERVPAAGDFTHADDRQARLAGGGGGGPGGRRAG